MLSLFSTPLRNDEFDNSHLSLSLSLFITWPDTIPREVVERFEREGEREI